MSTLVPYPGATITFEALQVPGKAGLFATIAAPPMNLLGPDQVRDLVSLIQRAEADTTLHVLDSAAPTGPFHFAPEQGLGLVLGAGDIQHLTRLMGPARALEVMLSAETTTRNWQSDTAGSIDRRLY